MFNVLAVFVGGGLGSLLRYFISNTAIWTRFQFPYATLIANALSCIILGILVMLGHQNTSVISPQVRLFAITGFCGGFSTYSTFTNETFTLLENTQWSLAILNIFSNLLLCLICILVGMWIGKFLN